MTDHIIIPCTDLLHQQASNFLSEINQGNVLPQANELASIATQFYNIVINHYAGEQFKLANVHPTISQTALKLFSATSKQLINFFIPRLKEQDIVNLSLYVKDRMITIDKQTYVGWPAPLKAKKQLSELHLRASEERIFSTAEIEEAKALYLEYQLDASEYMNDYLFKPAELITLGPINRRLVVAGKKATQSGAVTAIKRAVKNGNKEQLLAILNFQLKYLAEIN